MMQLRSSQIIVRWFFLLAYLFVSATAGTLILCEGDNEHLAIELASLPCPRPSPHDNETKSLTDSSSCKDTLISGDTHLSVQNRVEISRPLVFVQPPFLTTAIELERFTHQRLSPNSLPDHSAFASLRSVILLV